MVFPFPELGSHGKKYWKQLCQVAELGYNHVFSQVVESPAK
jgi:hypothetical protein